MKRYTLSEYPTDYAPMSEAEQLAWHNPGSYHSFHVERMGADTYRWRDSQDAFYYIGTHLELCIATKTQLNLRKLDPDYQSRQNAATIISMLTDEEVDDLFADL